MINDKQRSKKLPSNKPIILKNRSCVYCGSVLPEAQLTKEHVIGRRFVPKGSLNNQWNLIVFACSSCNGEKSKLENDISAITMQPDGYGDFASDDAILTSEYDRKSVNCVSKRTGKFIKDSIEEFNISSSNNTGLKSKFTLSSPPQIDPARIQLLSLLHLRAFFYFLTYDQARGLGYFWPGEFSAIIGTPRSDWGNDAHLAFMQKISDWEPRLLAVTAQGYFKVLIRKHPKEKYWGWGLEWNNSYRVIGLFGNAEQIRYEINGLPPLKYTSLEETGDDFIRIRKEQKLEDDLDTLFKRDS